MKTMEQKPSGPASKPRSGLDRLQAGIAKWVEGHPVQVVVKVDGMGEVVTLADDLSSVAEQIDKILSENPEIKLSLIGFGTGSMEEPEEDEQEESVEQPSIWEARASGSAADSRSLKKDTN